MVEFRYHRMTDNHSGWKRPHTGRLGVGRGYVSTVGFGHEDWNFSKEIWDDGRYHLYLRMAPSAAKRDQTFNIVLGVHTKLGHMVAGFAENVSYSVANLTKSAWQRRAMEIRALDEAHGLGPLHQGKSVKEIADALVRERNIYNVSVATGDLHILEQPVPIPASAYTVTTPLYRLLSMTSTEYDAVKRTALGGDIKGAADFDHDVSFPEGAQVEKLHKSRERNRHLVALAKAAFIKKHGALRCEACGMDPSHHFSDASLAGRLIEAHHNIGLTDPTHPGQTRVQDLSMLCPTCHRAIHAIRPWLTVEKLRDRLKRRQ